jgi:hypothetical protein
MPPIDKKENELDYIAALASTDEWRFLEDVAGVMISKRATWTVAQAWLDQYYEPIGGGGTGWQTVSETWTRTGNHTFTVATDLTAKYHKGTKVKYNDGGSTEYGVIGSSSYSAPNTTVNLIVNTDYAMAAGTITATAISYQEDPQGWPGWFNFTPTWTGLTLGSATNLGKWTAIGRLMRARNILTLSGSTVSTPVGSSFPVTAVALGGNMPLGIARYVDSSAGAAMIGITLFGGTTATSFSAQIVSGSNISNSFISSTVPFTWANGDQIWTQYEYEW